MWTISQKQEHPADKNERMPTISKKYNTPRREKHKNVHDLKETQQTQKKDGVKIKT